MTHRSWLKLLERNSEINLNWFEIFWYQPEHDKNTSTLGAECILHWNFHIVESDECSTSSWGLRRISK
jgi:hypothetical protein